MKILFEWKWKKEKDYFVGEEPTRKKKLCHIQTALAPVTVTNIWQMGILFLFPKKLIHASSAWMRNRRNRQAKYYWNGLKWMKTILYGKNVFVFNGFFMLHLFFVRVFILIQISFDYFLVVVVSFRNIYFWAPFFLV